MNPFLACNNDFITYTNNSTSYNENLILYLYLIQFITQNIFKLFHENQDKWIARIWSEYYAKWNSCKNDKEKIETYLLASEGLLLYYYVMQGTKLPSWFSECCLELPRLNNLDLPVYKTRLLQTLYVYLFASYLYADSLHETHPLYLLTYNLFRLFSRAFYGSF